MATKGQIAEQNMSTADQAALKAAGDRYNAAKAAGDTAAMEAAHKDAENIRAGYGYSGGTNGADYIPKTQSTPAATQTGGGGGAKTTAGTAVTKTTVTPTVNSNAQTTPTTTGQQSYIIRNGQRIATNFVNGHNVNADGTAIQWQPGDISVTPSGQYYIIGNDGTARQVTSTNTNDVLTLMNALGGSDGYTPKGSDLQIEVQQGFENWLKQDPTRWNQYLNLALEWNSANTRGDTAAANAIHQQMENFRKQYGHVGGSDGTLTRVVNPDAIPEELQELFGPLIEEYNQQIMENPEFLYTAEGQLMLMNIGQYPEFVRAVIAAAPQSELALNLEAQFPEYTVGEGLEKMQGLGYEAQYMPQYWNDFMTDYDYAKYEPEYDAIRDQLIAANQAGVDLGRMQLEAQLENALPEYDELRRQNALAQAKAANNVALYNQAQGDLGGIGSRRYSLEQNAYDQRMNEIQLEQQNLINTTNQQIAQLEAEGKMKEAELLAQWGQAKLEAMQEQYNLYWNMYQQGASAMENLEYGIASDEWNRLYQIRQDELNEQLNKYKADVDAYNAAVQKAQLELGVDESNRDYNYNRWKDLSNIALQQAQEENAYNADKYNAAVEQQKLQLAVDESNRDFAYQKYLDDRNYNYQLGRDEVSDTRYDQEWAEQLKEVAFSNALQKLSMGMLSASDVEALGVPASQATAIKDRINLLAQIDVDQAKLQLKALEAEVNGYTAGGSGGSGGYYSGSGGSGYDSVSTDTGLADWQILEKMIAAGVTPDTFYAALNSGKFGKMLTNSDTAFKTMEEKFTKLYNNLSGADQGPTNILDKLYAAGATENNITSKLLELGYDLGDKEVENIITEYLATKPIWDARGASDYEQLQNQKKALTAELIQSWDRQDRKDEQQYILNRNNSNKGIYVVNKGYMTESDVMRLLNSGKIVKSTGAGGKTVLTYIGGVSKNNNNSGDKPKTAQVE